MITVEQDEGKMGAGLIVKWHKCWVLNLVYYILI